MSVQFGILCRDCVQWAPSLGDAGYVGAPSLSLEPQAIAEFEEPVPTFAYLYEPLSRIGLRPYELERFRQWLEAHPTHRIALYGEQPPPEPDVALLQVRWESIAPWVYRQMGVVNETEPVFRELLPFLLTHVKHGVEASLVREDA